MQPTPRRQIFNRIFLGLALLWLLYCAVFVPFERHRRDEAEDSAALTDCLYGPNRTQNAPDAACMVRAEGVRVIHQTEWRRYYGPSWWAFLLVACGGFPLLVYAVILASVTFLARIRRIRNQIPPANQDDQYA